MVSWHTHAEINQMYTDLCNQYPEWCSIVSVGKTLQNNDIMMFRVGNPDGGRILYDSCLHGWEDIGAEIGYFWLKYLLENNITWILEGCWWLMIPVVNYDSNSRGNANYAECPTYGVDLNRNFVRGWSRKACGYGPYGTSTGASAASEPETQALRNVFQTYRPKYYINTHYGGWPWFGRYSAIPQSTVQPLCDRIVALASEMNVGCIWPFRSTGVGGGSVADAYTYGAISFLWECYGRGESPDSNCRIGVCWENNSSKNCCQAAIEMGKPEYAGSCGTTNPAYEYVENIVAPKSLPYFIALSEFSAKYKSDEFEFNISLL